ncbi:MAG: hypothetical protein GY928_05770 [Colwellia sp.]|nr:hypothetical protein [Colwellia sp.]
MKLKTIMYALAYGRSPEALKRSEGARRVQQGNHMLEERTRLRQAQKSLEFPFRYGGSVKEFKEHTAFESDYDKIVHMGNVKDNSVGNITWLSVPKKRRAEHGGSWYYNAETKLVEETTKIS